MRISDWSSDVCSSDLPELADHHDVRIGAEGGVDRFLEFLPPFILRRRIEDRDLRRAGDIALRRVLNGQGRLGVPVLLDLPGQVPGHGCRFAMPGRAGEYDNPFGVLTHTLELGEMLGAVPEPLDPGGDRKSVA